MAAKTFRARDEGLGSPLGRPLRSADLAADTRAGSAAFANSCSNQRDFSLASPCSMWDVERERSRLPPNGRSDRPARWLGSTPRQR